MNMSTSNSKTSTKNNNIENAILENVNSSTSTTENPTENISASQKSISSTGNNSNTKKKVVKVIKADTNTNDVQLSSSTKTSSSFSDCSSKTTKTQKPTIDSNGKTASKNDATPKKEVVWDKTVKNSKVPDKTDNASAVNEKTKTTTTAFDFAAKSNTKASVVDVDVDFDPSNTSSANEPSAAATAYAAYQDEQSFAQKSVKHLTNNVKKHWGTFAIGAAITIVALFMFLFPIPTLFVASIIFGIALCVQGVIQVYTFTKIGHNEKIRQAFMQQQVASEQDAGGEFNFVASSDSNVRTRKSSRKREHTGRGWTLGLGIADIVIGVIFLINPVFSMAIIPVLAGLCLVLYAVYQIITGIVMRDLSIKNTKVMVDADTGEEILVVDNSFALTLTNGIASGIVGIMMFIMPMFFSVFLATYLLVRGITMMIHGIDPVYINAMNLEDVKDRYSNMFAMNQNHKPMLSEGAAE